MTVDQVELQVTEGCVDTRTDRTEPGSDPASPPLLLLLLEPVSVTASAPVPRPQSLARLLEERGHALFLSAHLTQKVRKVSLPLT